MRKKVLAVLLVMTLSLSLFPLFVAAEQTGNVSPPTVSAESAVLMDAGHGLVCYEKNADKRLPMASTTKIMTALTALANAEPDRVICIPREAVGVEGSSVYPAASRAFATCCMPCCCSRQTTPRRQSPSTSAGALRVLPTS